MLLKPERPSQHHLLSLVANNSPRVPTEQQQEPDSGPDRMVKSKRLLLVPLRLYLLLQERKDSPCLSQCPAPTNAMLLALLRLCRLLRRLKTPETTRRQGVRLGTTTTTTTTTTTSSRPPPPPYQLCSRKCESLRVRS